MGSGVKVCLILLHIEKINNIINVIFLDINECQEVISDCHGEASCTNTDGNYTCTCRSGYIGDWKWCQGMPNITFTYIIITTVFNIHKPEKYCHKMQILTTKFCGLQCLGPSYIYLYTNLYIFLSMVDQYRLSVWVYIHVHTNSVLVQIFVPTNEFVGIKDIRSL